MFIFFQYYFFYFKIEVTQQDKYACNVSEMIALNNESYYEPFINAENLVAIDSLSKCQEGYYFTGSGSNIVVSL